MSHNKEAAQYAAALLNLLEEVDDILGFLIDPHSGKPWDEVEAMVKQSGMRGGTQFLRDIKSLNRVYQESLKAYNETSAGSI